MANLINCASCGRLFEQSGLERSCPDCSLQNTIIYETVKEYLILNPRAKLLQVATDLNIPVAKIKLFLKEGRIEIVEKDNLFLKCESCGKPICSGIYCQECNKQLNHGYKSLFNDTHNGSNKAKAAINYRKTK